MSDELLQRPPGDDVIVPVLMRKASFDAMLSEPDGRSVPVGNGAIGLVPARSTTGAGVYTFVVWSPDPVWSAAGEAIPANQASVEALEADDDAGIPY